MKIKNIVFVLAIIIFLISAVSLLSEIMWHIGYYISVNYYPIKHTGHNVFTLFMPTFSVSIIFGFIAFVFLMIKTLFKIKENI